MLNILCGAPQKRKDTREPRVLPAYTVSSLPFLDLHTFTTIYVQKFNVQRPTVKSLESARKLTM